MCNYLLYHKVTQRKHKVTRSERNTVKLNKMKKDSKIYIAGHTGLVGSSIKRNLESKGFTNFVFTSYPEYDLRNQKQVEEFFSKEKPEYVFLAAAK